MESTHETTKEWQIKPASSLSPQLAPQDKSQLATTGTNDTTSSHTSPLVSNRYSPSPTLIQPQQQQQQQQQQYSYASNTMVYPPVHSYPQEELAGSVTAPPPAGFMAAAPTKEESDPRLPGLMILSQPGTPRPNAVMSAVDGPVGSKRTRQDPYYSSFSSMPYPMGPPKRSRSDGLYTAETGPSFSTAKPLDNLYSSDRVSLLTVRVQSKMDRGFFLAQNDWTCYRRNYFQVSTTFGIHGMNTHPFFNDHDLDCLVETAQQGLQPVSRFVLGISARVSTNDNKEIELIQHTPKRDKGPQMTPEPKTIFPGGNLSLSSVGNTQNIATFERIQFKTATANNGKRRAAQQYYVLVIDLYAETHPGERVLVASCVSSPLVVRGRSPGHYADSHDRTSAVAAEPMANGDLYNNPYHRPMPSPTAAMVPHGYGPSPYGYYPSPYPTPPFSQGMMMSSPLPTPSTPSPHPTGSSTPTQQPYLVHSMSDPSSSESSSPDLYQPSDYHHPDKHHQQQQQQQHHHHHPMDPTGEWSRSRYPSGVSVASPEHHASYFSHHYPQHHTSGAPPTPITPFTRKYDTIPPPNHHHHHHHHQQQQQQDSS